MYTFKKYSFLLKKEHNTNDVTQSVLCTTLELMIYYCISSRNALWIIMHEDYRTS